MTRVFVIGIVHEETGLANVSGLLTILENIEPEVIFLEIPPAAFEDYANGTRSNLESTTANLYRANRGVDLVPVDRPTPEGSLFTDFQELCRHVYRTSPDYRRLMDNHTLATQEGGFPYLNSDLCIQAWANIYADELATLAHIGNPHLREIYDRWRHTIELRDQEMMKNIQDYCSWNAFAQGVLLVGAAHRGSLMDKARAGRSKGSSVVQWDFEGLFGRPP